MRNYYHPINWLIILTLSIGLSACSQFTQTTSTLSAKQYLALADKTTGAAQQHYTLLACKKLLAQNSLSQANDLLQQLPDTLATTSLNNDRLLLLANIKLLQHQPVSALNLVNSLEGVLSHTQQQQYLSVQAQSYQLQKNYLASINARNQLNNLLPNNAMRKHNLLAIWQELQYVPLATLKRYQQQTPSVTLQGWFNLAIQYKLTNSDTPKLTAALAIWRHNYPNHPANYLLPRDLPSSQVSNTPKHIALLLPLSGQLSYAGKSIRNGFLAAYYANTTNASVKPKLTIYDTTNKPINQLYQAAIKEGADLIVGPLTKSNVKQLINSDNITIPTLALNTLTTSNSNTHLFQFGLTPTDEAIQVAEKANQDAYHNALIIAPDSTWGKNIVNAFTQRWQQLNGEIIDTYWYQTNDNLAQGVRKILKINDSYARAYQLRNLIGQKFRFIPARRHDIDMIFLVANHKTASTIRPLIKFYYAGHLPIFSTSEVYQGSQQANRNKDLNGIMFPDMPWVDQSAHLNPLMKQIHQNIQTTWPTSFKRNPKLYALGVDAYLIANKLQQLKTMPQLELPSATGTLYLTKQQHVYRQLQWLQFKHGLASTIQ